MPYNFETFYKDNLDTEKYEAFLDKIVFNTIPWINYICEDSNGSAIFVRITEDKKLVGYFTGVLINKFGIKILGSPFPGWSTCHMGIDTDQPDLKAEIITQIVPYLYKTTKCKYIEICDRDISEKEAKLRGFTYKKVGTLELPIAMTDQELFKNMKTDCRNFIRQFERRGARLEYAKPDNDFAEEYYQQLEDVFAKQNLVPTYSLEKVKCLIRNMKDSGNILCLKVVSPDERCIATSLFLGYNKRFYFWGGGLVTDQINIIDLMSI